MYSFSLPIYYIYINIVLVVGPVDMWSDHVQHKPEGLPTHIAMCV